MPLSSGVSMSAIDGNITVTGFQGPIQFTLTNGNVSLRNVIGDLQGHVVNGNIFVGVGGDHWQAQTIGLTLVNGSVELDVPHDCSAHVELSTVIGIIRTNFIVPNWGRPGLGRTISFDAGSGGPLVRASVTVGSILLKRL